MKQQTIVQTTAESQNRNRMMDALSGGSITSIANGLMNIFLVQNKGKGPPGRVRSPVAGCCLKPDNHETAVESSKIVYKTQFQYFTIYHFSNFYSHNSIFLS